MGVIEHRTGWVDGRMDGRVAGGWMGRRLEGRSSMGLHFKVQCVKLVVVGRGTSGETLVV